MGESNSKNISVKYRYLHPSMVGRLDLTVSSNSDVGMSGSFVPMVKTYDGFYFDPEKEPCKNRYEFDKSLVEEDDKVLGIRVDNFDDYLSDIQKNDEYSELLKYMPIEIIERETEGK